MADFVGMMPKLPRLKWKLLWYHFNLYDLWLKVFATNLHLNILSSAALFIRNVHAFSSTRV